MEEEVRKQCVAHKAQPPRRVVRRHSVAFSERTTSPPRNRALLFASAMQKERTGPAGLGLRTTNQFVASLATAAGPIPSGGPPPEAPSLGPPRPEEVRRDRQPNLFSLRASGTVMQPVCTSYARLAHGTRLFVSSFRLRLPSRRSDTSSAALTAPRRHLSIQHLS